MNPIHRDQRRERYFDHAATAPMEPVALDAYVRAAQECFGNAHSIHDLGRSARDIVESAREAIAEHIDGASPEQIIFTSGATESLDWVLRSAAPDFVSPFEHSAVRVPALYHQIPKLENDGYRLKSVTGRVAVMHVNNETGAILDYDPTDRINDATQGFAKWPLSAENEFIIGSGHKLGASKGVGMIFVRDGYLTPVIRGGGQENGMRGGTLNVPAIASFGAVARLWAQEREERIAHAVKLRNLLKSELSVPDMVCHDRVDEPDKQSPFIISLSFFGIQGESLLIELDRRGFCVSSGPACSSNSPQPSAVLAALGLELAWVRGTIRVSFGNQNSVESTIALARAINESVSELRRLASA